MSSGVSFIPSGTGRILPVFWLPAPKRSKVCRSFVTASSFSSPVYSSAAFAVNPFLYRLFRKRCDSITPSTVCFRMYCTGSPTIPFRQCEVLKCKTSSVLNMYCSPEYSSLYIYQIFPLPAKMPLSSIMICTLSDGMIHMSSALYSPPYFLRLNFLRT